MLDFCCPHCGAVYHVPIAKIKDNPGLAILCTAPSCHATISVEAEVKRQFEKHFGKGGSLERSSSSTDSSATRSVAPPALGSWCVGIGLGIALLFCWLFVHPTQNHQVVRPPSGTSLITGSDPVTVDGKAVRDRAGLSDLTIENNADQDAVVKLAENERNEPPRIYRAVYVRAGDQWVVPNIAPGTYRLLFCLGTEWDPQQKTFSDVVSCAEFKNPVTFQETRTISEDGQSTQIGFDHMHIKLQATFDGNAQTKSADQALFGRGR